MTPHAIQLAPGFAVHDKTLAAGNLAVGVFTRSLCLSAVKLSDGFVSSADLCSLVDTPGVLVESASALVPIPVDAAYVAERLCEAGLWVPVPGGFVAHEYELYQPTREKLERTRSLAALRQRRSRASRVTPALPSTSLRSSSRSYTSASASVLPEQGQESVEIEENGTPPRGTLAWFVARLPGAEPRTATAISTVQRKWSLPEAALYAALEEVEAGGPKVRQPAALFIAKLNEYGRTGRYAR